MSLGLSALVSSRRREIRYTCVSTTTPSFLLNHVPSTTFAVLRATPGRERSFSMSLGTSPPNSSVTALAAPTIDFDLFRKKPVLHTVDCDRRVCNRSVVARAFYTD